MVVQKAVDEPVEFISENQLAGKEDGVRVFIGDLQAKAMQFRDNVGSDTRPQLRMETQIRGEAAIFDQVIGDFLFQMTYFFRPLKQSRIDFTYAHENNVAELFIEQPLNRRQRGQAQAIEAIDQQHCRRRVGVALSRFLFRRRENLRQDVS